MSTETRTDYRTYKTLASAKKLVRVDQPYADGFKGTNTLVIETRGPKEFVVVWVNVDDGSGWGKWPD